MSKMTTAANTILDHALAHIGRGWAIFPLHAVDSTGEVCTCDKGSACPLKNRGKHPANSDGFKSATKGDPEARKNFGGKRARNIGIACGRASGGLFAIDIDPGDGGVEQLVKLESELGALPVTAQARTGSGGTHYLFHTAETGLSISAGKNGGPFGAGVDHRSDGGYIVGVGSRSGRGPYTWVEGRSPDEVDVAELPAAWVKRIRDHAATAKAKAAAEMKARVVNGTKRHGDTDKAIKDYNSANRRDYGDGGPCPVTGCPGNSGFKSAPKGKWACWCPEHPGDVGHPELAKGYTFGDALDLDRALSGRSLIDHLIATGFLRPQKSDPKPPGPGAGGGAPPPAGDGAAASSVPPAGGRPEIVFSDKQLLAVVGEAWDALHAMNRRGSNPDVYVRGDDMVLVRPGVEGQVQMKPVDQPRMAVMLAQSADWFQETRDGGFLNAHPDDRVGKAMTALPDYDRLPVLRGVINAPIVGQSGKIISTAGYHASDKVWLAPPPGLHAVPQRPTSEQVKAALGLILDKLLFDFPFVNQGARANALAYLLTPFLQPFINAVTPMFHVGAPTPGSGKSQLVDANCGIVTGSGMPAGGYKTDEDEMRKELLGFLARDPAPMFVLDNIPTTVTARGGQATQPLDVNSGVLSSLLTSGTLAGRLLNGNERRTVSSLGITWTSTGNDTRFTYELRRRIVPISLDRQVEDPSLYVPPGGWKIDLEPGEWAREHRNELMVALLTLCQSWLAAGQPKYTGFVISSFRRWSAILGGILQYLQVPGFLSGWQDWLKGESQPADPLEADLSALYRAWWAKWGDRPGRGGELLALVDELKVLQRETFVEPLPALPNEGLEVRELRHLKARAGKLGLLLKARTGKPFAGFELCRAENKHKKGSDVWLRQVKPKPEASAPEDCVDEVQREIWPEGATH